MFRELHQTLTLTILQELNAVLHYGIPKHDHVLGHVLQQRQEAPLGVEPRVGSELCENNKENGSDALETCHP